jgi:hypothetical protein
MQTDTTDAETDMRLHRSRLMVAITAMNPKGLQQVLQSLPPSAQALETEIKAAQAVVELLSRYDQLVKEQADVRASAEDLRIQLESEARARRGAQEDARQAAAGRQAGEAQMRTELRAARGQAPPSSEQELTAMAQETRINELQAVVVSLQTQLRQSEMRGQQVRLELANAKESLGPTLKALKVAEEESEHTKRLLRTSESSNATLLTQVAALQQRVTGIAIGESRPPKPPVSASASAATAAAGVPVGGAAAAAPDADARAAEAAAAAAAAIEARVAADAAAAAEEPLPSSVEEMQQALRHERARVRVLQAEVSNARQAAEETLERQRRGADRGLREMQSEFARLHRITAEFREAVNGAEGRARGEESFRRRAEQGECLGWPPMASDDTLMAPDCELVLFLMTH